MTPDDDQADFLARVLGEAPPTNDAEARDIDRMAAALSQALDEATAGGPSTAAAETLAALVNGGLSPQELEMLLRAPTDRALAEAAMAFAEEVRAERAMPPRRLVAAARTRLTGGGAKIIPLRRRPAALPATETFQLLAASSGPADQAIVCRSESGLWTLRTFPGISAADRAAGRCSLLVTVNPEHASVYEGLVLRAFVTVDGEERVLVEAVVKDGSVFAEISLAGLDLRNRDPVSVVFNAAPSAG